MQNALTETKKEFKRESLKTGEYLQWHGLFSREFTKFLNDHGITEIEIGEPNYYDLHGFFRTQKGKIYFFDICDLRCHKEYMLIRTANHFGDYHGGRNRYIFLTSLEYFKRDFEYICINKKKYEVVKWNTR